ncbi:ribosomal protein P0 (A0) (L10E) [Bonamia ostreae]|uniref:Ribosomal protein P0 (A0) (L10E) n=1 Tax=Bonamia ostreae TaxID=126728 RepID=A0ABV2ATR7_9EUKA
MQQSDVLALFTTTASTVGAIGLETGVPNTISVAYSLRDAMRMLFAVTSETDYSFKEAEEAKEQMARTPTNAKEEDKKEEEEKEEEEEKDEGAGMGNLFNDFEEDSE